MLNVGSLGWINVSVCGEISSITESSFKHMSSLVWKFTSILFPKILGAFLSRHHVAPFQTFFSWKKKFRNLNLFNAEDQNRGPSEPFLVQLLQQCRIVLSLLLIGNNTSNFSCITLPADRVRLKILKFECHMHLVSPDSVLHWHLRDGDVFKCHNSVGLLESETLTSVQRSFYEYRQDFRDK